MNSFNLSQFIDSKLLKAKNIFDIITTKGQFHQEGQYMLNKNLNPIFNLKNDDYFAIVLPAKLEDIFFDDGTKVFVKNKSLFNNIKIRVMSILQKEINLEEYDIDAFGELKTIEPFLLGMSFFIEKGNICPSSYNKYDEFIGKFFVVYPKEKVDLEQKNKDLEKERDNLIKKLELIKKQVS